MQDLLAVLLCGGESRRMGSDKGLLPIGDTIWALQVAAQARACGLTVKFSINSGQQASYQEYIDPINLIVDQVEVPGPLGGLLTVHKRFSSHNLLLLACDMVEMDRATILRTVTQAKESPGYDFYVHQDGKYAQPFCGIYMATALSRISVKARQQGLHQFSMQYLLNGGHTKRFPIENERAFRNFNEREDWKPPGGTLPLDQDGSV